MKVTINEDKCFGCGGCIFQMEEVFGFNDDGHACIKKEKLTDAEKEQVKEFVDNAYCPGDAIKYNEGQTGMNKEENNGNEKESIKDSSDNDNHFETSN